MKEFKEPYSNIFLKCDICKIQLCRFYKWSYDGDLDKIHMFYDRCFWTDVRKVR